MNVILRYAKDALSDKIRFIDDVANGGSCGCVCPNPKCGLPVVAKNEGTERTHHFAHANGNECVWAPESALHFRCKQLVAEGTRIRLYGLKYFDFKPALSKFEFPINDIRPDVVLSTGTRELLVEIFVTNKMREEKRKKIIDNGLEAIELDVSDLVGVEISTEDLKMRLFEDIDYREMIPDEDELLVCTPQRTTLSVNWDRVAVFLGVMLLIFVGTFLALSGKKRR